MRVSVIIDAPPRAVWAAIADIGSHVRWMQDAEAIRFTSRRRSGVGTTFDCDTRVGPFRLVDRMEVTAWKPRREMGVRHIGVISGVGTFRLRRTARRRTRFTWEEHLVFPWWLGGPVGARLGTLPLRFIWRANLHRLKHLIESGPLP